MKYFENYYSNTVAGSGNQSFFISDGKTVKTGRIFFRVFKGGTYNYSLLYGNTVDSTFSDGSYSTKNTVCENFKIHSLKLGIAKECTPVSFGEIKEFKTVTFEGKPQYTVTGGGFFNTDASELTAESGDYICVEISFSGRKIPNHPESMVPCFIKSGDKWEASTDMPFPAMIGCDRKISKKIAYLGDSITQGIGVGINNYRFWDSLLSEKSGTDNGYWNLGLGYARADDAASDGCWLYKAKQADFVFICYGVNDLNNGFSALQIKNSLKTIVNLLHKADCKVLVQTVPPGDYEGDTVNHWKEVNRFILENKELSADCVFDCVPLLFKSAEEPQKSAIGNVHPNEEYSSRWAEALYPSALKFIENSP